MNLQDLLAAQAKPTSAKADYTPAAGWVNILYADVSIGGFPIESLKPIKGSSDFASVKNAVSARILEVFSELKEGEAKTISETETFSIEIRKVGETQLSIADGLKLSF